MEKYRLNNGLTVLFKKNNSNSLALEVMFKVGSNYEQKHVFGISHFLEHMLFEGTKKRPDSITIANEIEKYGAEFNAYTSANRTAFFIKIINRHFDVALDILSDMVANPLFREDKIEKEKKVVLRELDMITDDARQHQWVLFQKNLFEKHPSKNPTLGTIGTINGLDRSKILDYYKKYYVPNNMILSLVGNIGSPKQKIKQYFGNLNPRKLPAAKKITEPKQTKPKIFVEKRKMQNSYMVLGYKTVPRLHEDSFAFDVIYSVLGRGQSGWIFDAIRNKHGLSYQTGVQNESESDYGTFAVYAGLDKKNIEKAKGLILREFKKLQNISQKDITEAKTYIEGHHALEVEDNFRSADELAYWELIKDGNLAKSYIDRIMKVQIEDVKRVAKQYLNDNYTFVAIEQK